MISRKHAWTMWCVAVTFYAYQYILRVMPNVMFDDIMERFHIDISTFGQLTGVYYLGYSLIHLPLGLMFDRYGPKKIMPIFIIMTVIGMMPFVWSDIWIYPVIGRALIGVGSSAAILALFKVIKIGFREEHFSRMLSLAVTIGLIGAIYGGGPLNYMKQQLGFNNLVYILMVTGLIVAVIAFLVVPPYLHTKRELTVMQEIIGVFRNYKVIAVCILSGLMVGPLEGFADVWGTSFLKVVYGLNENVAASLPSLIFVGMCFGAPILSAIAERTGRYFATIITSAILMGCGFIAIISGAIPILVLSAVFVVIGVLCSYQIIAIYKVSTFADKQSTGLATAAANMIIMLFGYGFHSVIGKVISLTNTSVGGYTAESFEYGIAVIPVTLFVAAFGFIIISKGSK